MKMKSMNLKVNLIYFDFLCYTDFNIVLWQRLFINQKSFQVCKKEHKKKEMHYPDVSD